MAGNLNSGRHKELKTIKKELQVMIDDNMPDVVAKMIDKAREGDKDCIIRLFNHKFGMPHADLDLRIKGTISYSADDYALLNSVRVTQDAIIEGVIRELPEGQMGTNDLGNGDCTSSNTVTNDTDMSSNTDAQAQVNSINT
jgi:hypothetical protein